jgi:hypothetical protein
MRAHIGILALSLAAMSLAAQELPSVPTPNLDRSEKILLGADITARGLDTFSTRYMLTGNDHDREDFLPSKITNHTAALIGFEGGMVGVDYFAARYLNRHGHRRLARVWLATDASIVTPFATHNLFLQRNRPKQPIIPHLFPIG